MDFDRKTVAILLVILLVGFFAVYYGISNLQFLQVYSYAKEVPIQFGYEETKNFWVISAVLSEPVTFKMVLKAGSMETSGTEQVKTQSEVGVLFSPKLPNSKTNLEVTSYTYLAQAPLFLPEKWEKAPCYDVNDAGWLTTAYYFVAVYKNNVQQASKDVAVNYREEHVINLATAEGTVIVNNLGMIPQGVEVPSGDLIVVQDPYADWHLWNKADFLRLIDQWNTRTDSPPYWDPITYFKWSDVWNWAKNVGLLPNDVQTVHVAIVEYSSDMRWITLTYAALVFAANVACYIPSDLADTIIIHLDTPKPEIVKVEPSELPTIYEGEKTQLAVTVRNVGTAGGISVSVTSDHYAVSPLTETYRNFAEGETFTFKFELYALNVNQDTRTSITIKAQGRGGTATKTIYGSIKDKAGYTPPTPEVNTLLKVSVVNHISYSPLEDIHVSVKYGDKLEAKLTGGAGTVEFDLGKFTGAVQVSTKETELYQAVSKTVEVKAGTNEVTLALTSKWSWLDWLREYWWLLIILVATIIAIIVVVWKR